MPNALGKRKARRNRLVDLVLLVGTALLVAVFGLGVFWLADNFRLGTGSAFAVLVGPLFLVIVGRGYRSKLRDPGFIAFLLAWLIIHVAVFLLVLKYLGLLYYAPVVFLELWAGYALVIPRFGPPTRSE
jgi:hypothetical protein